MAGTASFAEESARILLAADTEPLPVLLSRVSALEETLMPCCTTDAERAELQQSAAATRLLVAQLNGASVADCLPLADALSDVARDRFRALQSLGSFSRYCGEHGARRIGAVILRRALDSVDWTALDIEDIRHVRNVYDQMLADLSR